MSMSTRVCVCICVRVNEFEFELIERNEMILYYILYLKYTDVPYVLVQNTQALIDSHSHTHTRL